MKRHKTSNRWFSRIVFLMSLLLPGLALLKLSHTVDPRYLLAWLAAVSVLTFFLYWRDKARAVHQKWRIPESTLHSVELLGGWPAAYAAQRLFRHKISKGRYQVTYWLIVGGYQLVCLDYLLGWWIVRTVGAVVSG